MTWAERACCQVWSKADFSLPPTIGWFVTRKIVFASLLASVAGTVPAIMVSLFCQLPGGAIFSGLALPALASIAPLIFYHATPLLFAAGVVWCYDSFSSEGVLTIIQSAGISSRLVWARILIVALAMTGFGYITAWVLTPWSAGNLHDVLFSLKHDINPALLRPGEFNEIDHGRLVVYFDQAANGLDFTDIVVYQRAEDGSEKAYAAPRGAVSSDGEHYDLVLLDGSMQSFDPRQSKMKVVSFKVVSLPLTMLGAGLTRPKTFVDELGPMSFLKARPDALSDPETAGWWLCEAFKRFGIPPLTIVHTLLGLGLLGARSTINRRRRYRVVWICGILAMTHIAMVVAMEQMFADPRATRLPVALVCAELAAIVGLVAASRVGSGPSRLARALASHLTAVARTVNQSCFNVRYWAAATFGLARRGARRDNPMLPIGSTEA